MSFGSQQREECRRPNGQFGQQWRTPPFDLFGEEAPPEKPVHQRSVGDRVELAHGRSGVIASKAWEARSMLVQLDDGSFVEVTSVVELDGSLRHEIVMTAEQLAALDQVMARAGTDRTVALPGTRELHQSSCPNVPEQDRQGVRVPAVQVVAAFRAGIELCACLAPRTG